MNWIDGVITPAMIYGSQDSEGYYLVWFVDNISYYGEGYKVIRWSGMNWNVPFLNLEVTFWMKLPELPAFE